MRVAVVGLGTAGASLHLPALEALEGARAVAGVDPDAECRRAAAERFGVETFGDFDAMLDAVAPDVVIVGTPPDSHLDYCLKALQAGAHVVSEKPFACSVREADRIIEAARRAERRVALNHQFREMPIFRAVRDRVGVPGVGDLVFVQVWQLMDLPPWAEPGWRGRLLQRTLFEAGVHLVDFLMALFGEKPVAVSATTSTCGVRAEASDAVALCTLEFSRGRLAHVVQNRLCKGETQYFEVRADCAEASLRGSFGGRARLSLGLHRSTRPHIRLDYGVSGIAWEERGNDRTFLARNPKDPGMVATRYVLEKTFEAFRTGGTPPADARVGREVLEVIAAAYRSAEAGRRIRLDGPPDEGLAAFRMGEAEQARRPEPRVGA